VNLLLLGFPVLNFAFRETIAEELPKNRQGSRPRPAAAGSFAWSTLFSYRANRSYLKAGTVFAAREDPTSPGQTRNKHAGTGDVGQAAHPPGTEARATQDAWCQKDL
jgi:hypothetical protein